MTLLLLAGTSEARDLARLLAASGIPAHASLAGATRSPKSLDLPTRIGGFGGADGFKAYVADQKISAVIDATHPFAHQITTRSARLCAGLGLPYLNVMRPGWTPQDGDRWTWIAHPQDAARHIGPDATVFLATGRQTLEGYADLAPRRILLRQIDPPTAPFPWEGGEFVIGRPPFSRSSERSLFEALGVDVLVTKDSGGLAARTKLDAARDLGISVLMLRRPPMTGIPQVDTVGAALNWALNLAG